MTSMSVVPNLIVDERMRLAVSEGPESKHLQPVIHIPFSRCTDRKQLATLIACSTYESCAIAYCSRGRLGICCETGWLILAPIGIDQPRSLSIRSII